MLDSAVALCTAAALLVAGYVTARATGIRRTPELILATWCITSLTIATLMHGLSFASIARRDTVLIATNLASVALVGCALLMGGRDAVIESMRRLARGVSGSPRAVFRSFVKRPLASIAVSTLVLVGLHAAVAAVLLPSESWDGIWYHDTITGWVIQTGSCAPMPLPDNLLQQVNGFPRDAELTSAWLALLADRRFIELPNALALAPLACGAYLLARRFTSKRDVATIVASVVALAPGCVLQLRSTYVDVYAAAACVAALAFATKRPLAGRDIVLAGTGVALHVGSKSTALLVAPIIVAFLGYQAFIEAADARTRKVLRYAFAAAAGLALAAAGTVYLKNAVLFGNPLYPIDLHVKRLGIDWRGVRSASDVDVNPPLSETLASIFLPASSGRDFADIRRGGYGLAVAWVLLPLACLGFVRAVRASLRRQPITRARARSLLCLVLLVTPSLVLSPALWAARYNLHAVVVAGALAAYALDLPRLSRFRAIPLTAALALSITALFRFDPSLGDAPLSRLFASVSMSAEQRASAVGTPWMLEPEVARARDVELQNGTIVVFGPGVTFPSVLYNERFDNRLAYVNEEQPADVERRVDELRPTWIVAQEGEPLDRYVTARPHEWERIGLASRGYPTIAYRRRRAP